MSTSAIAGTLVGCVGCQAAIEFLQREVKDILNLFSLVSCIFVTLEGLLFHSKAFIVSRRIPTRVYFKIVIIFFVVNICNNFAIGCDVSFPLFIIFKSGSLLANIVLGFFLRNHFYSRKKITSVILVTIGIIVFTLASYESKPQSESSATFRILNVPPFFIGIFLLTSALLLSAYLGICQEDMYRVYGKHPKECMFMVHFLSIPFYAVLGGEIVSSFHAVNETRPIALFGVDLVLPIAWWCIILICFLQFICVSNVYRLTAITTSLNSSIVVYACSVLGITLNPEIDYEYGKGTVFMYQSGAFDYSRQKVSLYKYFKYIDVGELVFLLLER
ncbi:hypothetical protein Q1695_007466 [Nippostrongylus brasiliensis]|nr:hypothetical protein Q1695_007466 [Nippostrongylus brasiliensis]